VSVAEELFEEIRRCFTLEEDEDGEPTIVIDKPQLIAILEEVTDT